MGNPLFWGKLAVVIGAAGGPILYFGLTSVISQKNREFKLDIDWEGAVDSSKSLDPFSFSRRIYQGIERGTRCFIKSWVPEEIYKVVMKFGEGRGDYRKGNWELSGVLGVRAVNLEFERGGEDDRKGKFGGLYERDDNDLDKYGVAVYRSKSGGGMLLFEMGTPVGTRVKKGEKVTSEEIKKVKEELSGKQIKVRRSVVSAWSRMEGERCKVTSIKEGEPIYRNYGKLFVDSKDVDGIRVLDWVSFNDSGVKKEQGEWQANGRGWGRYDHFSLEEKIEELIVGKVSDIKVEATGINDGQGNHIKWSNSFKPTITPILDK